MLRHVVLFKWSESATPEERAVACKRIADLAPLFPEVQRFELGQDAGIREGMYDAVLVADFPDVDTYRAYVTHPEHVDVIAEIAPIVAQKASVQHYLEAR
jgi:hypothetical protein